MLVLLASFSSPSWIFQIDLPYKDRVYLDRDPEERLALINRDFYEGKRVLGLGSTGQKRALLHVATV